ncbi:unnamed protein product [Phytomonas sp. EM1]|nr:unnamed protein product [Phytomonas sp. EM1]|eukprot:CCW65609.1 unnamed protein product [Phytomonas sp. isolate EM1]
MSIFPDTSLSGSVASRVASLLRARPCIEEGNASSLRNKAAAIESFLASAALAPPVIMESNGMEEPAPSVSGCSPFKEGITPEQHACDGEDTCLVELNVVAGVFEEKPHLTSSQHGLLLPSENTERELHHRQVEEAKAMLNLLGALAPSHVSTRCTASPSGPLVDVVHEACENELKQSTEQLRDNDSVSDTVIIMDADELDAEETTSNSSSDS